MVRGNYSGGTIIGPAMGVGENRQVNNITNSFGYFKFSFYFCLRSGYNTVRKCLHISQGKCSSKNGEAVRHANPTMVH